MAANLLNIVNQKPMSIDEEKFRLLCTQRNIWDHFGVSREKFSSMPDTEQLLLLRKFYFDLELTISTLAASSRSTIDSSISNAIENSSSLTMTKIIENNRDRSQVTVSTDKKDNDKKSQNLWPNFGCFESQSRDFSIEKANLPENTIFYISQGYQSYKDSKKVYYTDVFIIGQIRPLA